MNIKTLLMLISLSSIWLNYAMEEEEEEKSQSEFNQNIIDTCIDHEFSIIKSIIEKANSYIEDSPENKTLIKAIINNDLALAQEAINKGADVNKDIGADLDMLKTASVLGHIEIVKLLLLSKANVNAQNSHGSTALMYAAIAGKFDIIKLLLEFEADITIRDKDGDTAATSANMANYEDIEKFLFEKIDDANQKIKDLQKSFISAASKANFEKFEELLRKIIDIDCVDSDGLTALMVAVGTNQTKNVKLLLNAGVKNINAKDKEGQIALVYAVKNDNAEIVALLCENKADVNHEISDGFSIIRKAKSLDVIKILVSHGALVDNDLIGQVNENRKEIYHFLENDAFKLRIIHQEGLFKRTLENKILQATPLAKVTTDLVVEYCQAYDLPKEEIDKFFYGEELTCPN